jgi:tRNA (guanine37-N1)-methyltransferase
VPDVLLSGDHEQVAARRREQALRRTVQRRPDLRHPSRLLAVPALSGQADVRLATLADAPELLTLLHACLAATALGGVDTPARVESVADVERSLAWWTTFVVRAAGRLVGSVRLQTVGDRCDIGRILVAPDLRGRGLRRWLLEYAEAAAPPEVTHFALVAGAADAEDLRMFRKAGYRPIGRGDPSRERLVKPRQPTESG